VLYQLWSAIGKPGSFVKARAVSLGLGIGLFVFALAAPAACVGWSNNLHFLKVWSEKVAFNKEPGLASHSDIDSYTNQSLLNASHMLVNKFREPVPEAVAKRHWMVIGKAIAKRRREDWGTRLAVRISLVVCAGLLAVAGVKSARRGTRLGAAVTFGLSSMMIVMVAPVAWGHYYVLALPAVLFMPRWLWTHGHYREAKILAAWAALVPTIHYVAMPLVGDLGLLGIGTALWCLTAVVLYLRIEDVPSTPRPGLRSDSAHQAAQTDHGVTIAAQPASMRPALG
jgi:hypothetical protein